MAPPTLHLVRDDGVRLTGTVGQRIVSARGFRRMKQADLIDAMSEAVTDPEKQKAPSRKTLYNWEHDVSSPSVEDLRLLARALDVPVHLFVIDLDAEEAGPDDGPGLPVRTPPGTRTQNLRIRRQGSVINLDPPAPPQPLRRVA